MKIKSAFILAAGYGKRLRPLTNKVPKPLVKVFEKELLGHTLDMLISLDIKKIVINTHYKSKLIKDYIKKNYNKTQIKILYEKELLDTGGGVKNALSFFDEKNILIVNSDIYWHNSTKKDFIRLISFHNKNFNKNKCSLLLSSLLKSYGIEKNKGDFIKKNGFIYRNNLSNSGLIFSGAQIIDKVVFNSIKKDVFSLNMIWDLLIKQKKISGIVMNSNWLHVGNTKSFKYLNKFKT